MATSRNRKWLTGRLCLTARIRWWCRRASCLGAKPPPLTQAPSAPLHPTAARSVEPHPLHPAASLMLRPLVPADRLLRPLVGRLLLPIRRRRTAGPGRRRAPKPAGRRWTPSFPPSSSSSSATTPEELEPRAERTPRWASSTCARRVTPSPRCSSWRPTKVKAPVLHPGGSLSGRG